MRQCLLLAALLTASAPHHAGAQGPAAGQNHGAGPIVSPDGKFILFNSDRTGNADLYVIGIDGKNERQITDNAEIEAGSAWSADGRRILYSIFANDSSTLKSIALDGSDTRILGVLPGRGPKLLSDGRVMSATPGYQQTGVVISALDGTGRVTLHNAPASMYNASASPDGKQLAYTRSDTGRRIGVWLMNIDGSGAHAVAQFDASTGRAQVPAWSPDGTRLTFQASSTNAGDPKRPNSSIYTVELGTGKTTQITTHDAAYLDETPTWFPDGKRIAFQSNRTGLMEVWVMNADGTGARQITR